MNKIRLVIITSLGWSKDPGPPSGGEFPRLFLLISIIEDFV